MNPLPNDWFSKGRVDTLYIVTSEQLSDPLLTKFTGLGQTDFSFWYIQNPTRKLLLCGTLEAGVVKQNYDGPLKIIRSKKEIVKQLLPFFSRKKVGLNYKYLTASQLSFLKKTFPKTKFVDVSESLYASREIKTKEEIKKIKEAVQITQETLKKIPNMIHAHTTEIQLAAEIEHVFAREGCPPSFPTIVAFGKNSTHIHHFNTHKKIQKGSTILIDCGAKYKGYCADLSRTFVYKKGNEEQHFWYEKIVASQIAAFETIQPGNHAHHTFEIAEKTLGKKIPHALGHGIGLEVHDVPGAIYPKADWAYKENMALAIEPGYYGKKWGIRIEDDCFVTPNGNKRLSFAPKRLLEV